ncbi:MAG: sigma-54-dependent Fis family transcriptional regulator [Bacteroidales bacterium]|nr:sigma-54-dependent Fis family transcriptional regulator [Bacteroidales bacterium]
MDAQELQILKNRYDIIGNDPALNRALETAVAIAPTDLTVLIEGESGTGKENIPKIIHQYSRRKNGKYLAVNCGAIPEGTINAELFGHEKGAFTGAVGERKGYFEEANGGTLFLDEIGELPKETQAMLLRVLQNGEYMKVGSSKVEKTDVRVICATNVNLQYAVATGKFRQDLYYRINSIEIKMPPLRERKSDIYLLFRKFSSDFAQKFGCCRVTLDLEAISRLSAYRWPGNIRQLKNVAETITAIESKPMRGSDDRVELGADVLSRYLPDEQDSLLPATPAAPAGASAPFGDADKQMIIKALLDLKQEVDTLKRTVSSLEGGTAVPEPHHGYIAPPPVADEPEEQMPSFEEAEPQEISMRQMGDDLIERALARHGGKVKPAAKELGISERTIYRKLAEKKKKQ